MNRISSDVIRGYNDTMILSLLSEKPSYGYELSKKIREITDGKYAIKETTLYSAFNRMEKNGYITSFYQNEITEAGRAFYQEKCEEWRLTKEVVELFIRE